MTTTNTSIETSSVRELSATEITDVGGGGLIRNLLWQAQNAPANSVLIGCSKDFSVCEWEEK